MSHYDSMQFTIKCYLDSHSENCLKLVIIAIRSDAYVTLKRAPPNLCILNHPQIYLEMGSHLSSIPHRNGTPVMTCTHSYDRCGDLLIDTGTNV